MPDPTILDVAKAFRAQIDKLDAAALKQIVDVYRRMYTGLAGSIDALTLEIGDTAPTMGQLVRMERYQALMSQVKTEVGRFSGWLGTETLNVSSKQIELAGKGALALIAEASGVTGGFNRLPTQAIEKMLGFLQTNGPLFARLELMAPTTAQAVSDALVQGIGLGLNPRATAALMTDALGMNLTDALRLTRTTQLWAYREASRANYIANADVVGGWIWATDFSDDPCGSCIAMNGTEHGLDESLDDHYNGHCAMLPMVEDMTNPLGSGEEWFNAQTPERQAELIGVGKAEAYRAGKFDFADLTTQVPNDVYGTMRTETPLQDLIGD